MDSKKLFHFLKTSRTDQQGIPPLSKNDCLHTDTNEKANILNDQFQSVFTPLSPLSLKEFSLIKVPDLVDDMVTDPNHLPKDCTNATPVMPDIKILETGILHLLKNLKPKKAAGPDKIKPVVLLELKEGLPP